MSYSPAFLQLITRVDIWRQDVKTQTELLLQTPAKHHFHAPQSRHGMNLRSKDSHTIPHDRPSHQLPIPPRTLATISPNPRRSKRKGADYQPIVSKRGRKMDSGRPGKRGNATHGYKDEQDTSDQQGGTRPRGRPPGSKNKPKDVDKDFEQLSLGKIPPLPPSDPSSKASLPSGQSKKSSSPGKGSLSPGKKLGKQMDQIVPQEAVVIQMLGTFDPPVLLRSPQSLREDGIPIPEAVLTLYNTLRRIPLGNIPKKAEACFYSYPGRIGNSLCLIVQIALVYCRRKYPKEIEGTSST